jgi:ABC-type lipoprotein release transport system permease subunit
MKLLLFLPRKIKSFFVSISVATFLSVRQVKRTSKSTTLLIVAVMVLTFLNLIVIGGILVGLIEGSSLAYEKQYSGEILITRLANKTSIEHSPEHITLIKSIPEVTALSARYLETGTVEANYRTKIKQTDASNRINATFVGINPSNEDGVTRLSSLLIEGNYLNSDDPEGEVLVGSGLLAEYSSGAPSIQTLSDVSVGDKIRVTIGTVQKEVTVKGIIKSKIGTTGNRIYFTDSELRKLSGRVGYNVGEIALRSNGSLDHDYLKSLVLLDETITNDALVQTSVESQGQFFKDIGSTFNILGSVIGAIGISVASITIFIVIFVNAVSRRRYIGIMKGLGIPATTIEYSYIIQSLFYATVGIIIGLIILYGFLKPYFDIHPIDFPFSDGILYAPISVVAIRSIILLVVTVFAGYIPARMITKENTLDAILGR